MAIDNTIVVVGNLTDDPELRYTPQGVAVANVRVAVNQRFYNRETNSWDDRLDGYFTVNVWREYAENVAESLHRGTRVIVAGRLRSRSYEDKDGQTRWVTEIEADEIAPSLRWSRARLEKAPRNGSAQGGPGGGQSGGSGGAQGGPQRESNWGSSAPSSAPAPEEVPF